MLNRRLKIVVTILVCGFLFVSTLVVSDTSDTELQEIQRNIRDHGLQWNASETSIWQLPPEEQDRLCGAMATTEQKEHVEHRIVDDAPPEFDWRNVDGAGWMTSIKHQGDCGSCVAFATLGAFEATINIELGDPTVDPDLSEARLFFCGCGECCGMGWWPNFAADYLQNTGVPDDGCFPYHDYDMPCLGCDDIEQRLYRIEGWTWVDNNVDAIKAALLISPVQTTMTVYDDFFSYSGGIYEHVTGGIAGGHSVCVVGYNDNEGCWICKNSWGEGWGEPDPYDPTSNGGWFRIRYGNSDIGRDTTRLYGVSGWHILSGDIYDGQGGPLTGGPPYRVIDDLTVPAGETLTINPGVQIYFLGHTLTAIGIVDASTVTNGPIRLVSSSEHNGLKLYRDLRLLNGGYYRSG